MGTELLNSEFSLHSSAPPAEDVCQVHRSWSRHRRSRWIRSWNRICVRIPHHRLCQEPLPQAAAFLLCYPLIRSVRGHGTVLFDDGLPSPVRFLRSDISFNLYWWCSLKYE